MDKAKNLELTDASRKMATSSHPMTTKATYKLVLHVHALCHLFGDKEALVKMVRHGEAHHLCYIIGYASGKGFCTATQYPEMVLDQSDGLWLGNFGEQSLSNLQEALNIANHLKRDIQQGLHNGCEVWFATDNVVWAYVCNKGMSSACHLWEPFFLDGTTAT